MHSSDLITGARRASRAGWLAAIAFTAAGLAAPGASPAQPVQPSAASPACRAGGSAASPARRASLAALRRGVEATPLYEALRAHAGVHAGAHAGAQLPACRVTRTGGQWRLEYSFADGASLRVTSDASIEYADHTARVDWPAGTSAKDLLMRQERAAFPAAGCRVDWQTPEESRVETPAQGVLRIWRGDVCNCQGRVTEDANGRVREVVWRSAC